MENLALACLRSHEIPQVAHLRLADTVDTPKSLFKTIGVPSQIVVEHQVRSLQVDAFTCCVAGNQHMSTFILFKCSLRFSALFAAPPSMTRHYILFAS